MFSSFFSSFLMKNREVSIVNLCDTKGENYVNPPANWEKQKLPWHCSHSKGRTTALLVSEIEIYGLGHREAATAKTLLGKTRHAISRQPRGLLEVEQFTVLWILLIVIVAGNVGVLYTLIFGRSRKSRMNYFITHLAFADLCVGLINVLTDIAWRTTVSWNAGNVACKLIRFLQAVITYASTYVLVALSIDRYDAITHPMKFSGSWKRAKALVITAWLCSVLLSIPILILYEEKSIQGQLQCWIEFEHQWQWKVYMILVSVTLFIIPALIISSCYAIIIMTIWTKSTINFTKKTRSDHDRSGSDNSRRASSRGLIPRAKVKTIKITFVIVTVFILCWSPYIIFDLLQVYGYIPRTQTNIAIATFVQSLAPLNSAANPIIYCIFSTHFCKIIGMIPPFKWFCHKKKRKPGDSTNTTTQSSSLLSEFLTNHNTQKRRSEMASVARPHNSHPHTVLVHTKNQIL